MARIVDQFGNPVDIGRLSEPQMADTAWLRREFDTHPAKGLTPERLASVLLRGEQGDWVAQIDLAADIEERDGHAYAELSKRRMSIAALEWTVSAPKGATPAETAQAEQLQEWLEALPDFEDVLLQMMDGVLYGLAAHAITWRQDGRLRMPALEYCPQRWFAPDAARRGVVLRSQSQMAPNPPGLEDLQPVMGEPLEPMRWLVHTPASHSGYLTRSALARVLAWPYLFKHYSVRDFAEFLEIYGLPLRLGKYPSGASEDERMTLLRAVTDIGHNSAGIVPEGMTIDFQSAAAQGTQVPFEAMFRYMDSVESKVILGQTLSSGEGEHGTQALGTVHERVRLEIRESDARQVASTITRQLLVPLGLINIPGFDPRRAPRFELDLGEAEDIAAMADALPKLVSVGMRIPEAWAREKLRIPAAQDGEPLLAPAATSPAAEPADGADAPGRADAAAAAEDVDDADDAEDAEGADDDEETAAPPGARPAALAARTPRAARCPVHGRKPAVDGRFAALAGAQAPQRDAIDDMVDEAAAQWRPLLGPMVEPLLAELERAVAAGETLAAFADRLPQLVQQLDSSPLAQHLARTAFVARLAGEADITLHGTDS
jgi:phage gp29-like protein